MITAKKYRQIDYAIRYPDGFSEKNQYPLILFLHGAGGMGKRIESILSHAFFKETDKFNFNAVSVAPGCQGTSWFDIFEQLQDFIEHMKSQDFVDEKRIYLVGVSMGGYAAWQLAISKPQIFAAIVPICGGGMYCAAGRITNMGIWAFHGSDDTTVFCEESKKMVDAVNALGGDARMTIYNGVKHDSWTPAFNNHEMWSWLLEQSKRDCSVKESDEAEGSCQEDRR